MNREDRLLKGYMDLLKKMIWLNKQKMEVCLDGFKPSEVHCIECIGKNPDANVTKLAGTFFVTRGAISKMTRKLMDKGVIESYRRPGNKKEIYFRLTEKGLAVNSIHEELHKEFHKRDSAVFEQVTDEQFDIMLNFADMYNRHLDAEIDKTGLNMAEDGGFE